MITAKRFQIFVIGDVQALADDKTRLDGLFKVRQGLFAPPLKGVGTRKIVGSVGGILIVRAVEPLLTHQGVSLQIFGFGKLTEFASAFGGYQRLAVYPENPVRGSGLHSPGCHELALQLPHSVPGQR